MKFDKIKIFEKDDRLEQKTETHNFITVVDTNSNTNNITVNKPRKENYIPDRRKIVKKSLDKTKIQPLWLENYSFQTHPL